MMDLSNGFVNQPSSSSPHLLSPAGSPVPKLVSNDGVRSGNYGSPMKTSDEGEKLDKFFCQIAREPKPRTHPQKTACKAADCRGGSLKASAFYSLQEKANVYKTLQLTPRIGTAIF
jgi:hypothetical protein